MLCSVYLLLGISSGRTKANFGVVNGLLEFLRLYFHAYCISGKKNDRKEILQLATSLLSKAVIQTDVLDSSIIQVRVLLLLAL